jgi:DNA-3-methyladenine glycosylase II
MKTKLTCTVDLSDNYRKADFLSFHKRDSLMIAERVNDNSLEKGIIWKNNAACLKIIFHSSHAEAELSIDGHCPESSVDGLNGMVTKMLGLTQAVDEFEDRYKNHFQIGKLVTQNLGLRVPVTATPFEALTWAITGQQISVSAAVSIRRKFILLVGLQHSSGLWCYPDENLVSTQSEDSLRQAGLSRTKAQTIISVSKAIVQGNLFLETNLNTISAEGLYKELLQIRGIGPWTINYALLRGFG